MVNSLPSKAPVRRPSYHLLLSTRDWELPAQLVAYLNWCCDIAPTLLASPRYDNLINRMLRIL